ncbi:unnamed protein product [Amoebophrya sp. A25]|nr:unnamed protein product [Amoebophrya sp. A25]|eukprot:GSA25T00026524001.1
MLTQTTFPGEICNVAFAPYDSNLTLLVGKGGFVKLYKYNAHSGDLRSFPDFEGSIDPAAHFLTCVFYGPTPGRKEEEDPGGSKSAQRTALLQRLWAKQREVLVLNQAKQEIWMLDSQTLKIVDVMGECFDHTLSAAVRPMALATFQKGFIVGGSDGYLAIWERLDAHSYRFVRNLYTGRRSDLVSVDVVVDDDLFFGKAQEPSSGAGSSGTSSQAGVVLVFADGDMCYVNLAELYLAKDKIDFPASRSLAAHTGPIVAMSATASDLRPYFLTCAGGKEDSSLRIYNHETLELELSAFFSTEKAPVSAALHPDGFSCAVVFSDGSLRLFHLLATRLQVFFETRLPNLRKVAYSPTGHMLAVVHGKVVQIHDSVNMQKLTTLRKHSCNVADICFDFSGTSLATITVDGCFSVWSLTTFTRVAEYLCEPHKDSQDGNVLLNADDPATRAVQTRNIMSLYEQFAASIAFDGDITKGRHRWVVALNFKTVSTKETVGKMFGRLYDLYLVPPRNAETQDLPNDLELHCKLELPDQVYLTSLSFDRSLQSISRDDHHHPVVPVADRYGGSTLYATTIRGSVWVYPHPISLDTDYEELQLHSTRRKTARAQGPTLSGKKMLTGSMDGSLFLVQIGAPASKLPRGDDVCLVEKQELQKFEDKIDKLRHDLDSAKTESVQKLDQLKYAYEARLESNKLKSEKSEVEALKERIARGHFAGTRARASAYGESTGSAAHSCSRTAGGHVRIEIANGERPIHTADKRHAPNSTTSGCGSAR